jgi:flagellar basal-body rod modification protein FlgD
MTVQGINNPSTLVQHTPQTAAKSPDQALGRDAFMKLLVAQLRNQDPLEPLDSREFVTQLSQLTSVEQLVTIGERMQNLELSNMAMANTQSAGLVGKQVQARGDQLVLGAEGPLQSTIHLPNAAASSRVTIRDGAGQVVRTLELGKLNAGANTFTWDGITDAGARAPAGIYKLEFSAENQGGHPIAVNTEVSGVVTRISYEQGFPELVIGSTHVALSNVTSIGM